MTPKFHLRALVGIAALALTAAAQADGPPTSNGVISNPTLVANQNVAKAQAAGVITTFMTQGAQTCDTNGQNCHSVFGSDDTPDYNTLQQSSQDLTGVSTFSYLQDTDGSDDGGASNAVASQLGTLALACGDTSVHQVAGIAVKFTNCQVNTNGDALVAVQVCSAPARQNPITPPKNEVVCSTDPASKSYTAPAGYVCHRPACDTEPRDSLNGWTSPQTVSWQANLPSTATADQQSNNGLGLIFYPSLTAGQLSLANFTTDSDNMTAVKIVQSFINSQTNRTAVGLKIAYRHKTQVTKDMMVQGPSAVPDPGQNTSQWDTIQKLQTNASIPVYQQQYAKNGSDCLQQIGNGISKDGKISVCDPNYTNESGIKPLQKTAQVAVEGQDCGTTPQCLNQVVNTTTWTQSCSADVPTAMRSCNTTQDYTTQKISYTRTRPQEICHEARTQATYSCNMSVTPNTVTVVPRCTPGTWINQNIANTEFGAPGVDKMLAQYYCDPSGGDHGQPITLEVTAYGSNGDCGSGWKSFSLDFSGYTHVEQAAALSPHWDGFCNTDVRVDADVAKTCNPIDTQCIANLTFYHYDYQIVSYPQNGVQTCPAGQTFVAGYIDNETLEGSPDTCMGWVKNVITTFGMDFLRPGMDIQYQPPVDTCGTYEAAQ